MINELVDHYGKYFDAAMRMNCFNTKPTVASAVKYLKKNRVGSWESREFLPLPFQAHA